jgi:hypothetical protein
MRRTYHAQQQRLEQVGQKRQPRVVAAPDRHRHPRRHGRVPRGRGLGVAEHLGHQRHQLLVGHRVVDGALLRVQPGG